MFELLVLVNLLLVCQAKTAPESPEDNLTDEDFGTNLVTSMRNDANLDLTADEEYEDLRAELLAYHTALASFSSDSKRSKSRFFFFLLFTYQRGLAHF